MMAQYEPKPADLKLQAVGEGFLHQVPDSQLPRQFVLAYPRMSMHEHAGGLGLRQWHRYAHTGFVGMWSLSWQSCMIPVCAGSNTLMPAYPALGEIIEQAERVRVGEQGESVTQLAVHLAVAWESCRKVT